MSSILNRILGNKGKKNRDSLEIVRDVLSVASEKTRNTRIMYQANLSYRIMEKYLNSLLEGDLLERVDDSFYVVTWRGKEFLQMYNDYVERCRRIGEEIGGVRKDRLLLENMCFNNNVARSNPKELASEKEVPI